MHIFLTLLLSCTKLFQVLQSASKTAYCAVSLEAVNTVTQGLLVFVPSGIAVIHHILVLVNVKQFKSRPCRSKIDAVQRNKFGRDEVFDTANLNWLPFIIFWLVL